MLSSAVGLALNTAPFSSPLMQTMASWVSLSLSTAIVVTVEKLASVSGGEYLSALVLVLCVCVCVCVWVGVLVGQPCVY